MYQNPARTCASRTRRVGVLALSVALALVGSAASSALAKKGPQGSACDPARPAVAHYSGGVPAPGKRASAPVPCMSFVGTTSEAGSVGVTRSGSLFYAPLLREHISAAPEHAAGAGVGRPLPGSGCELDEARLRRPDHGRSGAALDEHRPAYVPDLVRHHAAESLRRTDLVERRRWRPLADQPVGRLPRSGRGEAAGGSAASPPDRARSAIRTSSTTAQTRSTSLRATSGATGRSMAVATFNFIGAFPIRRCRRAARRTPVAARASPVPTECSTSRPTLCGALGVAISRDEGASWQFRPIVGSGLEDIYTSGPPRTPAAPLLRLEGPRHPSRTWYVHRSRRHLERSTDGRASRGAGGPTCGDRGSQARGGSALVPGNHRRRSLQRLHHRESQRPR